MRATEAEVENRKADTKRTKRQRQRRFKLYNDRSSNIIDSQVKVQKRGRDRKTKAAT